MAVRLGVCAAAAFLVLAEPASAGWRWDATRAARGLDLAVSAHRLSRLEADGYRTDLARVTAILATSRPELRSALRAFRDEQTAKVREDRLP